MGEKNLLAVSLQLQTQDLQDIHGLLHRIRLQLTPPGKMIAALCCNLNPFILLKKSFLL
jgi:hypothetical protein